MQTVTSSFTRAIAEHATSMGVHIPPLLRRAIFSVSGNHRLPMAVQDQLWTEIIQQSQDPGIGLRIGMRLRPGHFDTLGHLIMSSPTLKNAIETLIDFSPLVGQGGRFLPLRNAGGEGLRYDAEFTVAKHVRIDAILLSTLNGARWLSGEVMTPSQVCLSCPQPPHTDRYVNAFGTDNIQFDSKYDALIFSPNDWLRSLNPEQTEVRQHMVTLANKQLAALSKGDWISRVVATLNQQPAYTRAQLANSMNISERQLNRRLAKKGVNFKMLSEQAKRRCALEILSQGRVTQAALAVALGYSDESAFAKAFKRWTGKGFRVWNQTQHVRESEHG